jgi:hypothetical protein
MRSKDDRVEKIKKHLSYEVWMLGETYIPAMIPRVRDLL